MAGKTPLIVQATDLYSVLSQKWEAALADGRIDTFEAIELAGDTALLGLAVQRAAVAQLAGLSMARYGEEPRAQSRELAELARRVAETLATPRPLPMPKTV